MIDPLRIAELRNKVRSNDPTLTIEELREGIAMLREGRTSAASTAKKSADRTAKPPVDGNALLDQLLS